MTMLHDGIRAPDGRFPHLPRLAFSCVPEDARRLGRDPGDLSSRFGIIADFGLETDGESFARRLPGCGAEIRISLPLFLEEDTLPPVLQAGVRRVWVDHVSIGSGTNDRYLDRLHAWQSAVPCIPVCGDPAFLERLTRMAQGPPAIAIKGSEAAAFSGGETLALLFEALSQNGAAPCAGRWLLWGGLGTAEAAAAFLCLGAAGVVFESLHSLTSVSAMAPHTAARLATLQPEDTTLLSGPAGFTGRFFDKGNSQAVRRQQQALAALAAACGEQDLVGQCERICALSVPLPAAALGSQDLVPMGPEAAFAHRFAQRYGYDFPSAARAFERDVDTCCAKADQAARRYRNSPAASRMGTRHPIIQGAMSCITDNLVFAKAVAAAGALPTLAMGYKNGPALDRDLGGLRSRLGSHPYAVNVIALEENPFREEQFAWIERESPPCVVLAAGDPQHVRRFKDKGIASVGFVATNPMLARMAMEKGADFVVCEGCEAGGHVGTLTSLVFAQAMLVLRQDRPEIFSRAHLYLAGGIFSRRSVFLAAMLGADGFQMGTPYLTTEEIVSSGAISELYRNLVLGAPLGGTIVTGEAAGLRIRSLRTPVVTDIQALEAQFRSGGMEESAFRRHLETMGAGSLLIAARECDSRTGCRLDRQACLQKGQFMSGASAGLLATIRPIETLHRDLLEGPLPPFPRPVAAAACACQAQGGRSALPPHDRFAVTGMAVANSLGNDVAAMWAGVLAHASGIAAIGAERGDHRRIFHPAPGRPGKTYCRMAALHPWEADRKAMGIAPQDFRTMAHSTRLTLWLAQRAIEESGLLEAGIAPERIGVIVSQNSGEMSNTLDDLAMVLQAEEILEAVKEIAPLRPDQCEAVLKRLKKGRIAVDDTTLLGRLNCAAGGFICNRYGFRGPSFAVSAACATGLVALWTAYRMLMAGVLDAAVVGGGEERVHPGSFLEFSALRALAGSSGNPSQACRPFDARRDGMVLGEGGAVLVLEREALARKRRAPVHALLCGMGATNNDKGMVESLAETQIIAIRNALDDAAFTPESVGLVECHATGTLQGDREEVRALRAVFPRASGTALTSFKSQIGHTLGASGLTSAIRGICALREGRLPPTLHYTTPDPAIGLEEWGFRVPARVEAWPRPANGVRRLMVNSFGFGGANYVALLEESPGDGALPRPAIGERHAHPRRAPVSVPTVHCFSSVQEGRELRIAVVADSPQEARLALKGGGWRGHGRAEGPAPERERNGVFMAPARPGGRPDGALAVVFSGQGSAYPGLGKALYDKIPAVRARMDRLAPVLDRCDILAAMFGSTDRDLRDTRLQQPALYIFEYALAGLLFDAGLAPRAMAGHSMGELTALCLAGVFSPEDGLRLVDKRAQCMHKASRLNDDPGRMIAVNLPAADLQPFLLKYPLVRITNLNSPLQTVLGGESGAVSLLGGELEAGHHRVTPLKVGMAFHSPAMRIIREEMQAFIDGLAVRPPSLPVISNTTRQPFPDDPGEIRRIIMDHLETPVHWIDNLRSLQRDFGADFFLEIGPTDTLCGFIADTLPGVRALATGSPQREVRAFSAAVARLYTLGAIDAPVPPLELPPPRGLTGEARQAARAVVQREIARYALDGVQRFLKPALLEALRREIADTVSADEADELLAAALEGPALAVPPGALRGAASRERPEPAAPSPRQAAAPAATACAEEDPVLEAVIRIIIGATGYGREEIAPDMDIRSDLSIRSSRLPVILDAAERHFGVPLHFGEFIGVRTVRQVAGTIRALLEKAGARPEDVATVTARREPAGKSPALSASLPPPSPLHRCALAETGLVGAGAGSLALSSRESVLIASLPRSALADQAAQFFSNRHGAPVFPCPLDGTHALPPPAENGGGIVFCLPDTGEAAGLSETVLLGRLFGLLKTFLAGAGRRFALALAPEGSIALQGACGLFMTAALEFRGIRFLAVGLGRDVPVADALQAALTTPGDVVEIVARPDGCYTRAAVPCPASDDRTLPAALGKKDVLLVSGGGRGITAGLAEHLALSGCAFILLGSSDCDESDDNEVLALSSLSLDEAVAQHMASRHPHLTEEERLRFGVRIRAAMEIRRTLAALRERGARAIYHRCDVTDPDQVRAAAKEGASRFGALTGVIHGAGLLRDGFLSVTAREDFERVVAVKLQGALNLIEATRHAPLRFFAAFSSMAALQGNPGQAGYCAANRAMAAAVRRFAEETPGCLSRVFWLPPVMGRGMAEDPEIREILNLRGWGNAYIGLAELAGFFLRELRGNPGGHDMIVPTRYLPANPAIPLSALPEPAPDDRRILGFFLPPHAYPMIDSVATPELERGQIETYREIGFRKDPWLADHRPFKKMAESPVSAIMAVEMFLESASLLAPHLTTVGLRDIRFHDIIPVLADSVVKTRCLARMQPATKGAFVVDARLEARNGSTATGDGEGAPWREHFSARVLLAADPPAPPAFPGFPVQKAELETRVIPFQEVCQVYGRKTDFQGRYRVLHTLDGTAPHAISGTVVYKETSDFNHLKEQTYCYSPYLLEALLQLGFFFTGMRNPDENRQLIPLAMDELWLGRPARDGENLSVEARISASDDRGVHLDARALDLDRQPLMCVRGIRLQWYTP